MNAGDVYSPRAVGPNGTYPARPGFPPDRPHTRGFAPPGFRRPGVSPLAMIRRPYRALPCTRPGCRPGGP